MLMLSAAPPLPEHTDPDRWQAALPEPFSFINEILQETIDDVLLAATVKEAASALESAKPVPDDESGAAVLGATLTHSLPAVLESATGSDTLLAGVADGVFAVALGTGGLWLWDTSQEGAEPLALAEAVPGKVPCVLLSTPLPISTGSPQRLRLAPSPHPRPLLPRTRRRAARGRGEGDGQLLVFDVTPPDMMGETGWQAAPVADFKLAAFAPARASLSSDGRFVRTLHDAPSPSTTCRFQSRWSRRRQQRSCKWWRRGDERVDGAAPSRPPCSSPSTPSCPRRRAGHAGRGPPPACHFVMAPSVRLLSELSPGLHAG